MSFVLIPKKCNDQKLIKTCPADEFPCRYSFTDLQPKVHHGQGRIQDFHGGGGQKIMCAHAHHEREVPYACMEALGVFDALLCYLSLIIKHSDTNGILKKRQSIKF